jgi:hypothetical protein
MPFKFGLAPVVTKEQLVVILPFTAKSIALAVMPESESKRTDG